MDTIITLTNDSLGQQYLFKNSIVTYLGIPLFALLVFKSILQIIIGIMILKNNINKWNVTYMIAYFIGVLIIFMKQEDPNYVHIINILITISVLITLYLNKIKNKNILLPLKIGLFILLIGEIIQPYISNGSGFITLLPPYFDIIVAVLGILMLIRKMHKIVLSTLIFIFIINLLYEISNYYSIATSGILIAIILRILEVITINLVAIMGLTALHKERD